jgi:hypothetical protein
MQASSATHLFSQLAPQLPVVFILGIAMLLAILFLRRAFWPSVLTLVAAIVIIGAKLFTALVQSRLLVAHRDGEYATEDLSNMMSVVGFIGVCVQAVGMAMLVAAIFVGRSKAGLHEQRT